MTIEEITASEDRYRILIDTLKDVVFTVDRKGRILFANRAAEEVLGFKPAEVLNTNLLDYLLDEDRVPAVEALARGMQGDKIAQFEVRARSKSGEVVVLAVSGSRLWEDGKAVGALAIARDVTARKQHEDAVSRSEELFRATLEATADGIVAMNKRGRITHANAKFIEMWRLPETLARTLDDKALFNFMMGELKDPAGFFMAIQELFVNLGQSMATLEFKDDRVFEHQSAPLIHEGRIAGRVWSFKDITLRRRAQRELEAANQKLRELDQMKDNFLSMVSHDLRTPMTAIMAYAQILREQAGTLDARSQTEYLGIILKQSERLTRLINDLLDVSKFEAGKMALDLAPLDLIGLAAEAADAFNAVCAAKNIKLDRKFPESAAQVLGDRDRLHQVMANLLSNAVKFTPPGGTITVSAQLVEKGGMPAVRISVADTGPGIPEDEHDRVFEKFHQAPQQAGSPAAYSGGGSGLGLALVKEIVTAHSGRAGLQSKPGHGATFFFILPLGERGESR